jgi:hypothetical protein
MHGCCHRAHPELLSVGKRLGTFYHHTLSPFLRQSFHLYAYYVSLFSSSLLCLKASILNTTNVSLQQSPLNLCSHDFPTRTIFKPQGWADEWAKSFFGLVWNMTFLEYISLWENVFRELTYALQCTYVYRLYKMNGLYCGRFLQLHKINKVT